MRHQLTSGAVACLLLFTITVFRVEGQTALPGPPRKGDWRLLAPLRKAGIALNVPSLIEALKHEDVRVARSAAEALSRFAKSERVVRALTEVVAEEDDEILVTAAAYSLVEFDEVGWVDAAVKRLPSMEYRTVQIQFSGLLARAGHGEGWPVIASALVDENFTSLALENVSYFDRKKAPDGNTIDVIEELHKLSGTAPQGSRRQIQEKLLQLRTLRGDH